MSLTRSFSVFQIKFNTQSYVLILKNFKSLHKTGRLESNENREHLYYIIKMYSDKHVKNKAEEERLAQ